MAKQVPVLENSYSLFAKYKVKNSFGYRNML